MQRIHEEGSTPGLAGRFGAASVQIRGCAVGSFERQDDIVIKFNCGLSLGPSIMGIGRTQGLMAQDFAHHLIMAGLCIQKQLGRRMAKLVRG